MIFKSKVKGPTLSERSESKGFTLIELLIVVAIIGILAALIVVNLNVARKKARDAKRKSDISEVQTALVMYSQENGGSFPVGTKAGVFCYTAPYKLSNFLQSQSAVGTWISSLAPSFIVVLPNDPINNANNFYGYCSNGTDYKLLASNMESSQGESWARNDGGTRTTCPYSATVGWCAYELFTSGAQAW